MFSYSVSGAGTHRRFSRFSVPHKLLYVVIATAIGCGGEPETQVSDSGQHLIEARDALIAGDTAKAKAAYDASIAAEPNRWAFMERAKLNAREGKDDAVLADCAELLKLDPKDPDVPWLKGELKKPAAQRFTGASAVPPSHRK